MKSVDFPKSHSFILSQNKKMKKIEDRGENKQKAKSYQKVIKLDL